MGEKFWQAVTDEREPDNTDYFEMTENIA